MLKALVIFCLITSVILFKTNSQFRRWVCKRYNSNDNDMQWLGIKSSSCKQSRD